MSKLTSTISKGRFLSVEGTEGVGKSTNIQFVQKWLEQQGIKVCVTREPGGTPFAEEIRELLLQPREEQVTPTAELLLMFAARSQHLNQVIIPAIERGEWVLCDRFTDATFAYQGSGRNMPTDDIKLLESLVQRGLHPDLTILLDLPVEVGMARAHARSEPDRFEQEKTAFFERVRSGYHKRVEQNPNRFAVIDASPAIPEVQQQIATALQQFLDHNQ